MLLFRNEIEDLGPVKGLKRLQSLSLEKNLIHDITPVGTLAALQYLNLEGTGETGTTKPEATPAAVSLSDKELYEQAKKAYDSGKLEDARQGFIDLLKQHPKSQNADNAQFWIGETYYREKWFEKAILEYQKVIEKYPQGNKVPASRLKQGLAFSNLGDKTNARLILQELIKQHPQSNEAKIAKKKLKKLK